MASLQTKIATVTKTALQALTATKPQSGRGERNASRSSSSMLSALKISSAKTTCSAGTKLRSRKRPPRNSV